MSADFVIHLIGVLGSLCFMGAYAFCIKAMLLCVRRQIRPPASIVYTVLNASAACMFFIWGASNLAEEWTRCIFPLVGVPLGIVTVIQKLTMGVNRRSVFCSIAASLLFFAVTLFFLSDAGYISLFFYQVGLIGFGVNKLISSFARAFFSDISPERDAHWLVPWIFLILGDSCFMYVNYALGEYLAFSFSIAIVGLQWVSIAQLLVKKGE